MKTTAITTLSEQETVCPLIEEVRAQGFEERMVADGYSHDRTTEVATELGADVVSEQGKEGSSPHDRVSESVTAPHPGGDGWRREL